MPIPPGILSKHSEHNEISKDGGTFVRRISVDVELYILFEDDGIAALEIRDRDVLFKYRHSLGKLKIEDSENAAMAIDLALSPYSIFSNAIPLIHAHLLSKIGTKQRRMRALEQIVKGLHESYRDILLPPSLKLVETLFEENEIIEILEPVRGGPLPKTRAEKSEEREELQEAILDIMRLIDLGRYATKKMTMLCVAEILYGEDFTADRGRRLKYFLKLYGLSWKEIVARFQESKKVQ